MADEPKMSPKRAVILAGATEVFRQEGFEAASMDRIAEVCGVSKRTIYNHFGSKEVLFQTVVEHLVAAVVARKQILWDPQQSLESQLRAFAMAKVSVVSDPQWLALVRVVLGIGIQQPERAREVMLKAVEGEAALVRWLREADRAGALRVPDAELASKVFWGLVAGTLFWPQIFEDPMSEKQRAALLDEILATFLDHYRVREGEP